MPRQDAAVFGPQPVRDLFRDVYRPVLAAGTAYCHRQIGALKISIAWDPAIEKGDNIVNHLADSRLASEEVGNQSMGAIEKPQPRLPVRVWQTPYVEYEIRISGNPCL